jgi:acyl carrier protein
VNHEIFLSELSGLLEKKMDTFALAQPLESHALWDSLAAVSVIGLADQVYGITLSTLDLASCETVFEILKKIEARKS